MGMATLYLKAGLEGTKGLEDLVMDRFFSDVDDPEPPAISMANIVPVPTGQGIRGSDISGDFSDIDFSEYPTEGGVPQPTGDFRVLEGEEYKQALKEKNAANTAMHKEDASIAGKDLHEVHPVKYGGSPTDPANKIALERATHVKYSSFWARTLAALKKLKR